MADELDRCLYRGATLNTLPSWVLLNATNLRTGKAWKFFHDRVGDYLIGATDQTQKIRVADAVAASAAYPGLADAFRFEFLAGEVRPELLDPRWGLPPNRLVSAGSDWRKRFLEKSGRVVMPLVDGGAYDNEGLIGLRSAGVTHAVMSSTSPPDDDAPLGWWPLQVSRMVEVIHARLGGATRQLAHEITHAVNPTSAGDELHQIAQDLRNAAKRGTGDDARDGEFTNIAIKIERLAQVGEPGRGHQFQASAPVLLNKTEVARNQFAGAESGGLNIPPNFRGAQEEIVDELARVRTDLDALSSTTVDLLIAQGYFLTDAYCKLCMPEAIPGDPAPDELYASSYEPNWKFAIDVVKGANANVSATVGELSSANVRTSDNANRATSLIDTLCGRSDSPEESDALRFHLVAMVVPPVLCAIAALGWLIVGLVLLAELILRHM